MKVAVYTANIGSYRNEDTEKKLNSINFMEDIDYYFFTDKDIKLKKSKWIIQKVNVKESYDFIDKFRNTAKFTKFHLPDILKSYDYAIWCDTKSFHNVKNLSKKMICDLVSKTNKKIYLLKHPRRENILDELRSTKNIEKNGVLFLKKLKKKKIKFNSYLPDTTILIRKIDSETNIVLAEVYNYLIDIKLCRDQNIIQYVFYKMNFENNLFYFKNVKDFYSYVN